MTKPWSMIVLALAVFLIHPAGAENGDPGAVSVVLQNPEEFTDLEPAHVAGSLTGFLESAAAGRLHPGQTLEIVITDVDMAGGYEPGTPLQERVRMLRPTFPPRIDVHFTLRNETGDIIREGQRTLRDLNYQMRPRAKDDPDPLVYERIMLHEWLTEEFGDKARGEERE